MGYLLHVRDSLSHGRHHGEHSEGDIRLPVDV